jgi:hypothetical protein
LLSHGIAQSLSPGPLGVGVVGATFLGVAMFAASAALRPAASVVAACIAAVRVPAVAAAVDGELATTPPAVTQEKKLHFAFNPFGSGVVCAYCDGGFGTGANLRRRVWRLP